MPTSYAFRCHSGNSITAVKFAMYHQMFLLSVHQRNIYTQDSYELHSAYSFAI